MMIKNKPMNDVKSGIVPLSNIEVPVAIINRKPKMARGRAIMPNLDGDDFIFLFLQ
jgi:hypothetical protein